MDVRCEKCQTEYELDEARLKPGGVTVKCTNCGHMFKIRKRTPTHVGAQAPPTPTPPPQPTTPPPMAAERARPGSSRPFSAPGDEGAEAERHWLIRLENGEQKSCRELATLQQWIIANIVTRESLISRTGKTWKRLGDISELAQYFDIADEARSQRAPAGGKSALAGTMLGFGTAPKAAGGTIIPDDDEIIDTRSTGSFARPQTASKIPAGTKTPPMGSGTADVTAALAATTPARRPTTTPPPAPKREPAPSAAPSLKGAPPEGNRATGGWAKDAGPVKPEPSGNSGPSGPFGGKVSAIADEPAFAGRVRAIPSDEASFQTGKVRMSTDDDEDLVPRRGGRSGIAILLMVLLVGGGAAFAVYHLVLAKDDPAVAGAPVDAVVATSGDASAVVSPITVDAGADATPHEVARAELAGDVETRLRTAMASLAPIDEPPAHAIRALLVAAIAQSLTDRAALVDSKAEADKLRKEATTLLIDAATAAQKAQKALPDDPSANLAMAEVLRLQGKSASAFKQYAQAAKAKAGTEWARDVALHEAHVLRRDAGKGKLGDALAAFTAIDSGAGALERSADVRARFQRAMILLAQSKASDAKPLVAQVLAAQPEHGAGKALGGKLETLVTSSDPLPPEDTGKGSAGSGSAPRPPDPGNTGGGGGDSYDSLLDRANKLADSSCTRASEMYQKALEQKPNGIEALTGLGYCHIDSKQYASAHSRFRSALAISPRYEPALTGIAEAYQQQGLRDEAIAAYRAVLESHPNSPKAKRQLERLTGGGAGGSTGGGEGSGTPPTTPTTPPTPTPTPTPVEGSGAPTPAPAGSGSGAS